MPHSNRTCTRATAIALVLMAAGMPRMLAAQTQQGSVVAPLTIADDKLDYMGTKFLREVPTVIVPTAFVYLPVEGKLSVFTQGGMFSRNKGTARATLRFTVSGLEKGGLQSIARQLQDDLVKQLRAQGLTVLTYDDVKDKEDVQKMDRLNADKDWDIPTRSLPTLDGKYLVATPSDAQAIKPAFQGPVWGWRGVSKGANAIVVIPEYVFNSPQLWGEKGNPHVSTLTAKVNASPGVTLVGGTTYFINNKSAGGLVKLKEPVIVADSVGTLAEARDRWEMTVDRPRLADALLRGGMAYNAAFAAAMAKERK